MDRSVQCVGMEVSALLNHPAFSQWYILLQVRNYTVKFNHMMQLHVIAPTLHNTSYTAFDWTFLEVSLNGRFRVNSLSHKPQENCLYPKCTEWWSLNSVAVQKRFAHSLQTYGFTASCRWTCFFKPQKWSTRCGANYTLSVQCQCHYNTTQVTSCSTEHFLKCLLTSLLRLYSRSHRPQENCLYSECTGWWHLNSSAV